VNFSLNAFHLKNNLELFCPSRTLYRFSQKILELHYHVLKKGNKLLQKNNVSFKKSSNKTTSNQTKFILLKI
jgi:hypothetical protein